MKDATPAVQLQPSWYHWGMKFFLRLIESYIFVLLLAIVLGLAFPSFAVRLAPYSTVILGIIFFLSALKIDVKDFKRDTTDWKMLAVVNLWMLFALPVIVFMFTRLLAPEFTMAFVILAAMPAGMTSPLLSDIIGGRQSLALILTMSTSLLAPFTVPLMVKFLGGATVQVSFWSMFVTLGEVIFIPFILAALTKKLFHVHIKAASFTFKPISIILLGLLIMSVVAKQSGVILRGFTPEFVKEIVALFILFGLFHVFGYFTCFWRDRRDRLTITVCTTYMNFTLAIYLVGIFFDQPNIIVPVVLSVLPWSLLMVPFKAFAQQRLKATRHR